MERGPKEKGGGYVIGEDARKAWKGFNSHENVKGCNPGVALALLEPDRGRARHTTREQSTHLIVSLSIHCTGGTYQCRRPIRSSAKLHETVELG